MASERAPAGTDALLARPAGVCAALLKALGAAEGRRRMRKRDQTPDALGLAMKRALLEQAVADDPSPQDFEGWLLDYVERVEGVAFCGAAAATARSVLEEWRLAHALGDFVAWLEQGAPSDDAAGVVTGRPGTA